MEIGGIVGSLFLFLFGVAWLSFSVFFAYNALMSDNLGVKIVFFIFSLPFIAVGLGLTFYPCLGVCYS